MWVRIGPAHTHWVSKVTRRIHQFRSESFEKVHIWRSVLQRYLWTFAVPHAQLQRSCKLDHEVKSSVQQCQRRQKSYFGRQSEWRIRFTKVPKLYKPALWRGTFRNPKREREFVRAAPGGTSFLAWCQLRGHQGVWSVKAHRLDGIQKTLRSLGVLLCSSSEVKTEYSAIQVQL